MTPPLPDTHRIATLLAGSDYFRRSPSRLGGRGEYKEWQHFIVHAGALHLLVNFNLLDEVAPGQSRSREVARLIVLAHGEDWEGEVERFHPEEVEVEAGRLDVRMGRNSLRFEGGAFHLSVALRERPLAAELVLVPTSLPGLSAHHPLTRQHSLSWLFLPRLVARGTLSLGGRTWQVEQAPAYHDHNWGHFRWGDDFSWEWASLLPDRADNPWSAILVRMMDRGRSLVRHQGLFLWYGSEPLRIFRDEELHFSAPCGFQPPRPFTLPRPMALLAPGAADLPRTLRVRAQGRGDSLELTLLPRHAARLVLPVEDSLERVVTLHEVLGEVELRGQVRGEAVDMEGEGVFEFIRE